MPHFLKINSNITKKKKQKKKEKEKRKLTLDWEFVLVILLHTSGCSKADRKSHLDILDRPAR